MRRNLSSLVGVLTLALLLTPFLWSGQSVPQLHPVASKMSGVSWYQMHQSDSPVKVRFVARLTSKNRPVVKRTIRVRRTVAKRPVRPSHHLSASLTTEPVARRTTKKPFTDKNISKDYLAVMNEVASLLPEGCQEMLEDIEVYTRSPARGDKKPSSRGFAGPSILILSEFVTDMIEFASLTMHELGHVVTLNHDPDCLGGTKRSGIAFYDGNHPIYNDSFFAKYVAMSWQYKDGTFSLRPGVTLASFPSEYSATDPYEDAAEMIALAAFHGADAGRRAAKDELFATKLAFVQEHVFPHGVPQNTSHHQTKNYRRPDWDVTKFRYEPNPTAMPYLASLL